MSPYVLFEKLSDKNTAMTLNSSLKSFLSEAEKLNLPDLPMQPPMVVLGDCAPQVLSCAFMSYNIGMPKLERAIAEQSRKFNPRIHYANTLGPMLVQSLM